MKNKVVELVGKDIIKAYDGRNLSPNFGFSCANFNCEYQKTIDMEIFDFYIQNPNNISCFAFFNNEGKIEGRKMFFKGKQLLSEKKFQIVTKRGDMVYYMYGYYGNTHFRMIERYITTEILKKYGNSVIYTDYGTFFNRNFEFKKNYWIMEIDNMDFDLLPPIDALYASYKLKSLSNFNPSKIIIEWLEKEYDINEIEFDYAYRYKPFMSKVDKFKIQHWNQKYYKSVEDDKNDFEEIDDFDDDFDGDDFDDEFYNEKD